MLLYVVFICWGQRLRFGGQVLSEMGQKGVEAVWDLGGASAPMAKTSCEDLARWAQVCYVCG